MTVERVGIGFLFPGDPETGLPEFRTTIWRDLAEPFDALEVLDAAGLLDAAEVSAEAEAQKATRDDAIANPEPTPTAAPLDADAQLAEAQEALSRAGQALQAVQDERAVRAGGDDQGEAPAP